MIVRTPRPSSPTRRAHAPANSTSEEAFERLPSLSFSRWRWIRLRSPSGRNRGIRKHEMPPSACASTRNASHIGADMNHLWPVTSYSAPGPPPFSGRAVVVFARTSEPPCFSVIPIPHSAPFLSIAGTRRSSYASEPNRGSHSAPARAGSAARGSPSRSSRSGTSLRPRLASAASRRRRVRRERRRRALATAQRGCRARRRSSSARARQDGTRPRRRGCRSGRASSGVAGSRWRAAPARSRPTGPRSAPNSRSRPCAHSAPSRATASVRTVSASKTL